MGTTWMGGKKHVCIGGVTPEGRWVRPVPPGEKKSFSPEMLMQNGRVIVEPGNEVEFLVLRQGGKAPHSEDVEVDIAKGFRLVHKLTDKQFADLLSRKSETAGLKVRGVRNIRDYLVEHHRSMILLRADEALGASAGEGRIRFKAGSIKADLVCTDLRWRAFLHEHMPESEVRAAPRTPIDGGEFLFGWPGHPQAVRAAPRVRGRGLVRVQDPDEFSEGLRFLRRAKLLYLAIGLTRDTHTAIVGGVHAVPSLKVEVDYSKP